MTRVFIAMTFATSLLLCAGVAVDHLGLVRRVVTAPALGAMQ